MVEIKFKMTNRQVAEALRSYAVKELGLQELAEPGYLHWKTGENGMTLTYTVDE